MRHCSERLNVQCSNVANAYTYVCQYCSGVVPPGLSRGPRVACLVLHFFGWANGGTGRGDEPGSAKPNLLQWTRLVWIRRAAPRTSRHLRQRPPLLLGLWCSTWCCAGSPRLATARLRPPPRWTVSASQVSSCNAVGRPVGLPACGRAAVRGLAAWCGGVPHPRGPAPAAHSG